MDRAAGSGLEIEPATGPEIAEQPNASKYYVPSGASSYPISSQPDTSDHSHRRRQGPFSTIWTLAVIAIVCLAVALGAGLGAGLAAQHKSSSSSGTVSATIRATSTPATGGAPAAVTQSGTTRPISSTPATLPSASCPAANGSTYTATNKPLPTIPPDLGYQITSQSLLFEILCNTNLADDGHIIDVQLITNVSTLNDCLDECALYSFRTRLKHFPTYACTAIAWSTFDSLEWPICWLKSNATLGSANQTNSQGPSDGAVLLGIGS